MKKDHVRVHWQFSMSLICDKTSFSVWFEPPHDKTNKMICAPSEDSDQPGHLPSLISVFAVRSMGSWGPNVSSCGQRRHWSDRADAQADLSLRWAHMSFMWRLICEWPFFKDCSFWSVIVLFSDLSPHPTLVSAHRLAIVSGGWSVKPLLLMSASIYTHLSRITRKPVFGGLQPG